MNDDLNTTYENPLSGEDSTRAYPSCYLNRTSATILMVIKLAEGLSKLCLTILAAFLLQTVVTSLNRIFQQGSTVEDGKAIVAQFLKTLQVPAETIKQVVDAFPLNITFSSKPVIYVFVACLPFVVIAVLEAVAAIRLRLGKGGTRTIGILQRIYYVLGVIRLLACALLAVAASIFTIIRIGGTVSIILSTIYVSLAVFYILVELPTLLYHRNIAEIMDDVRYEMTTGMKAARRKNHFREILIILIILEVIGVVVSVAASWNPQQGGAAMVLIVAMIGPAAELLKYICVMCCHKNFLHYDSSVEPEGNVSHTPQIILIVLVTLFFAVPNIFLCLQSSKFSAAIVEKVEEFFSEARQTVNEISTEADAQIQAVQSAIAAQTGEGGALVPQDVTKEEAAQGAQTPQDAANPEGAQTPQDAAKPEGTGGADAAQNAPKEEV